MDEFVGLNHSVKDFRRWVLSDWKSPTTRGMLAEYYVRCAMEADGEPANDFEYVDIILKNGKTIEVKATAYLQPVKDGKLKEMKPNFQIKKKTWAWSTKLWDWLPKPDAPKRWADCYVLCLENMRDPNSYDPLNLSQWEFFVIPTSKIDETFGDQKSVTVGRLRQEGFNSVAFGDLTAEISRNVQS